MIETEDTICAIASGMTTSGIGIIRISGSKALAAADKVMRIFHGNISSVPTHTVNYGYVYDGEEMIDEVLTIVMHGPRSYTGEDTVEIQCHGGPYIMQRILETVCKAGARLAEPGEFTKRAFLNGRIDLSQAESVMDLIGSESEYARAAALAGVRGELGASVSDMRAKIIYESAYLEAALDDPEHISLDGYSERLKKTLVPIKEKILKLIAASDEGEVLKHGIKTVILGKPNAGKSTLLNLLLGKERAIVTSIPGTTRDTIEETIRLDNITLRLIDTAGLRDTDDEVESIGVKKALEIAEDADLIIYVVDVAELISRVTSDDCDIRDIIIKENEKILGKTHDKPIIVLANKADIAGEDCVKNFLEKCGQYAGAENTIIFSAKEGRGRRELEELIKHMFVNQTLDSMDEMAIANQRQKQALIAAGQAVDMVLGAIEDEVPEDLYTVDLLSAYSELGKITGESVSDDLVNTIFEKFCMGK